MDEDDRWAVLFGGSRDGKLTRLRGPILRFSTQRKFNILPERLDSKVVASFEVYNLRRFIAGGLDVFVYVLDGISDEEVISKWYKK